jgi:glutamine amidotransferase
MSCQNDDSGIISLQSLGGGSSINKHGWGIAYYKNGRGVVEKGPERAKDSERFKCLIKESNSSIMIGHTRLASSGIRSTDNSHPFKRSFLERDWVFAHNGSVPSIKKHPLSEGQTDSEQVFHEMLDVLEDYVAQPGFHGIYPGIKKAVRNVLKRYSGFKKPLKFNFLLTDGLILYAYNHYKDKPLYASIRQKGYGGAIVVSNRKLQLGNPDWSWMRLPANRLLVLSDGQILTLGE